MNYNTLNSLKESKKIIKENDGVLFFFSTTKCSLGDALEPKVYQLIEEKYPKILFYHIDIQHFSDIAAHYSVFIEPTILVFFDGKEFVRKSRNISIAELSNTIYRLYKIIFY